LEKATKCIFALDSLFEFRWIRSSEFDISRFDCTANHNWSPICKQLG